MAADSVCSWCGRKRPLVCVAVVYGRRWHACRRCSGAAKDAAEGHRFNVELDARGGVGICGYRTSYFGPGVVLMISPKLQPRSVQLLRAVRDVFDPWRRIEDMKDQLLHIYAATAQEQP